MSGDVDYTLLSENDIGHVQRKRVLLLRFLIQAPMRLRSRDRFRVAVYRKPSVDVVVIIPAIHWLEKMLL
ncbi:hypothetical protein LXL04_018131 [Taraxacum kok-saghyz]